MFSPYRSHHFCLFSISENIISDKKLVWNTDF